MLNDKVKKQKSISKKDLTQNKQIIKRIKIKSDIKILWNKMTKDVIEKE
jgi:hypothetical protein